MDRVLAGKVALVTGAGSGIGRASAQALARAGAAVILVGRTEAKVGQVAAEIEASGGRAIYAECDVADRDQMQRAVKLVLDSFGRIDILVNSAGINTPRRGVADISMEDWDRVVAVNLTGAFNCVRAVLPEMKVQGEGLVINIVSLAGKRASQLAGVAYSAAKHGQKSLTDSINIEEGKNRIRATSIFPGEVDTNILSYRPEPVSAERRAKMLRPEDIAACVLFVASLPPQAVVPEILIVPQALYNG